MDLDNRSDRWHSLLHFWPAYLGTLVGVLFEGEPKFGMMSQPYVKDCFIGGGGVATLIRPDSSSALSVRPYRAINEATVLSTAPEMFKDHERRALLLVYVQR